MCVFVFLLCGAVSCRVPRVVGWLGAVRCGAVRCGVVWCGVVCCGVLWCVVVCCGVLLSIYCNGEERSVQRLSVELDSEDPVVHFGEPLNHVMTLRGPFMVSRKLAIRDEPNIRQKITGFT